MRIPTFRELERRLLRLEAANTPQLPGPPMVVRVGFGEAIVDAGNAFVERLAARFRKKKPIVLIVPAKPRNDAEEAEMLARFKVQQEALVADAKASRPAPAPPEAMPEPEQEAPERRLIRGRVRIGEPFRAPKPEPKD